MTVPDDNPKTALGALKPDLSLVPPAALIYMALAMGNGADKYGPYNWRLKRVSARTYVAAAMRHMQAWLDGEDDAADSGIPHLAHAMASIGILVDAKETGNLNDNRPTTGVAGVLIDRFTKLATSPTTPPIRSSTSTTTTPSTGRSERGGKPLDEHGSCYL